MGKLFWGGKNARKKLCVALSLLFSIYLLLGNKTITKVKKLLIIFLLIIGNLFMLPFFWYLFILHE
jgi:hypothetical protein